jgi:hypothetical protein
MSIIKNIISDKSSTPTIQAYLDVLNEKDSEYRDTPTGKLTMNQLLEQQYVLEDIDICTSLLEKRFQLRDKIFFSAKIY